MWIGASQVQFAGLEPVIVRDLDSYTFRTPALDDAITIDEVLGQGGLDWNRISGTSGGVEFESLQFANVGTFILDTGQADLAGGGSDSITFASGLNASGLQQFNIAKSAASPAGSTLAVSLAAGVHLKTGTGGSLRVGGLDSSVMVLDGLSLGTDAQLDLNNFDAVIRNGNITTISSQIASGRADVYPPTWDGSGIVSSRAKNFFDDNFVDLLSLGAVLNSDLADQVFLPEYDTFRGVTVSSTDVLIRSTYTGDADLTGEVDGSDYQLIDTGYNFALTPLWVTGDFNYDAAIDGSDYQLIDTSYGLQGVWGDSSVVEGTTYVLNLPDRPDGHWEINWGDGITETFADGATLQHLYQNNRAQDYVVSATFVLSNGTRQQYGGLNVEVTNAAPSSLQAQLDLATASPNCVVVSGRFLDPGLLDTHQVLIQWDELHSQTIDLPAGVREFSSDEYSYGDNENHTVAVTVTDSDGDSITRSTVISPSGLSCTGHSPTAATFSWDSQTSPASFQVRRIDGEVVRDYLAGGEQRSIDFNDLSADHHYTFRVRAFSDGGVASAWREIGFVTESAIAAPSGLTATADSGSRITLTWNGSQFGEDGYHIYRSSGSEFEMVNTIPVLQSNAYVFQDTGLTASTTYTYRVCAYQANSEGRSAEHSVTTLAASLPAAPTDLMVIRRSRYSIDLSWTDHADNESGFQVERGDGITYEPVATVDGTYCQDYVTLAETHYHYRVRAINSLGASGYATAVEVRQIEGVTNTLASLGDFVFCVGSRAVLAVQADGKMVVGATGPGPRVVLFRFNSDGSVDQQFGAGGQFSTVAMDALSSVTIQSDGKILLAGGNVSPLLMRFDSDGEPDHAFNQNVATVVQGWSGEFKNLVLEPNGRIVAAGYRGQETFVARFEPTGTIDNGYGETAGTTVVGPFAATANGHQARIGMAIQPDGKVVLAYGCDEGARVQRLTRAGHLDNTFGDPATPGTRLISRPLEVPVHQGFRLVDLALAPDGSFAVGATSLGVDSSHMVLISVSGTGQQNQSLVFDGFSGLSDGLVAVQPDGKVLLTGLESQNRWTTLRAVQSETGYVADPTYSDSQLAPSIIPNANLFAAAALSEGKLIRALLGINLGEPDKSLCLQILPFDRTRAIDLSATPTTHGTINLRWAFATRDDDQLIVERKTEESEYESIATLPPGTDQFLDTGVQGGVRYTYRVHALNQVEFPSEDYTQPAAAIAVSSDTAFNAVPASTLAVFTNGAATTLTLQNGRIYKLRVSRLTQAGLDAEYDAGQQNNGWNRYDVGLVLGQNGQDFFYDLNKYPHWGTYSDSHAYEIAMVGEGQTLTLSYHGYNLDPNSTESITVEIYEDLPPAPTEVSTSLMVNSSDQIGVRVAWNYVGSEVAGFIVERSDGSTYQTIQTVQAGSGQNAYEVIDNTVVENAIYCYRVTAYRLDEGTEEEIRGIASNGRTITTTRPDEGPILEWTCVSATRIDLSWESSDAHIGYRLERSANNSDWIVLAELDASIDYYADSGLSEGSYQYRLLPIYAAEVAYPVSDWQYLYSEPLVPAAGAVNGSSSAQFLTVPTEHGVMGTGALGGSAMIWQPSQLGDGSIASSILKGDFNGDGREDVLARCGHLLTVGIGTFNPTATGVYTFEFKSSSGFVLPSNAGNLNFLTVADFNGDGLADLAWNQGAWKVALSNGESFEAPADWGGAAPNSKTKVLTGDFDGNGRADLSYQDPDTGIWYVGTSTGNSFAFRAFGQLACLESDQWLRWNVGDFNCDGLADVIVQDKVQSHWFVGTSTGTGFLFSDWGSADGVKAPKLGDFNGDGRTDVAWLGDPWTVCLSSGGGFTRYSWRTEQQGVTTTISLRNVQVGDFDGDGCADLIGQQTEGDWWVVPGTRTVSGDSLDSGLMRRWYASTPESTAGIIAGNFLDEKRAALRAFEEVYNTIEYQPYRGAMKGWEATEDTKRGNDWDQAALLIEKLRRAGIQGKYAYGTISASTFNVQRWLGVNTESAADMVLTGTQLKSNTISAPSGTHCFSHAVVQVVMASEAGIQSQCMDPSWKFREQRDGIVVDLHEAVRGSSAAESTLLQYVSENPVHFDENGRITQPPQPLEWFEGKIAQWLRNNAPSLSLADVRYDGPIVQKRFDVLPRSIGYVEPQAWTVVAQPPDEETHRLDIALKFGETELITETLRVAEVSTKSIMLKRRADNQKFELLVDGIPVKIAGVGMSGTAEVTLIVARRTPGVATDDSYRYEGRKASETLTVTVGADQFSPASVAELQMKVHEQANAYVLAKQGDRDFINNNYVDFVPALAGAEYWTAYLDTARTIGELSHYALVVPRVSSGVVSSGPVTVHLEPNAESLTNQVFSSATYFDMAMGYRTHLSLGDMDVADQSDLYEFIGGCGSFLESYVLEKTINTECMSTVKGLQLAVGGNIPIQKITAATNETQLDALLQRHPPATRIEITRAKGDPAFLALYIPDRSTIADRWTGSLWVGRYLNKCSFAIFNQDGTLAGPINGSVPVSEVTHPTAPTFATAPNDVVRGDPVSTVTGAVLHDENDGTLPAVGMPIVFGRHFDSYRTNLPTDETADVGLGVGWMHSFGDYLTFESVQSESIAGKVTWVTGDGYRHSFESPVNGIYKNPGGVYGQFAGYVVAKQPDASGYFLLGTDGTLRVFSVNGRLRMLVDRNKNVLKLTYSGQNTATITSGNLINIKSWYPITADATQHAADRVLTLNWTGNHITGLTDDTGRTWAFEYSNDGQRLKSAQLDGTGLSMQYTYHTAAPMSGLLGSVKEVATAGQTTRTATTSFEYYSNRRAMRVTDAEGGQEVFDYDLFHNVTHYTNANGNTTSYYYNADGLTTRTINPDRTRVDDEWGSTGAATHQLQSVTDELGCKEEFKNYDAYGNYWQHVAKDGLTTTNFQYTSDLKRGIPLKAITRPAINGKAWKTVNCFDSLGNLTQVIEQVVDAAGNVVTADVVSSYTYDLQGRVRTVTVPRTSDHGPVVNITTFQYADPADKSQTVTRRQSFTIQNSLTDTASIEVINKQRFDSWGNLVEQSTTTESNPGAVAQRITHEFDAAGRELKMVVHLPDPSTGAVGKELVTQYEYLGRDRMLVTAPLGRKTRFAYDGNHRLVQIVNADGTFRTNGYDALGNVIASADELGRVTQYVLDTRGRRIQTLYADGALSSTRYDGAGRAVATTDPLGRVTSSYYDMLDRLKWVVDPINQGKEYRYDDLGNVIKELDYDQVTLTNGVPSTVDNQHYRKAVTQRDDRGRVVQTSAPDLPVTKPEYDAAGNIRLSSAYSSDDPDLLVGQPRSTWTLFDEANRPMRTQLWQKDAQGYQHTIWTYDPLGRLATETDTAGRKIIRITDDAGRLWKEIRPHPTNATQDGIANSAINVAYSGAPITKYMYDDAGNVKKAWSGTEENLRKDFAYEYDLLNRQVAAIDNLGQKVQQIYDAAGQLVARINEAGHVSRFFYDDRGRKIREQSPDPDGSGPQTPITTLYAYDAAGNLISTINPDGVETRSEYDALNRVVGVGVAVPVNITHIGSEATATTTASLGLRGGETVTVGGADQALYNGSFNVSVVDDHTFKFTLPSDPGANATGTITARVDVTSTAYSRMVNGTNTIDVVETADALGNATTKHYDLAGRLVTEMLPENANGNRPTTIRTYDVFGNVETVQDANSALGNDGKWYPGAARRTTTFTYDCLDRKIMEYPPSPTTGAKDSSLYIQYTYNGVGDLLKVRDQLGQLTATDYDRLHRIVEQHQPVATDADAQSSAKTSYLYDARGIVHTQTDPDGNKITFQSDTLDRPWIETRFSGATAQSYSERKYTSTGQLAFDRDHNGRARQYVYDYAGRETVELWLDTSDLVVSGIFTGSTGITTVTTTTPHGLSAGDRFAVRGARNEQFNGEFTVPSGASSAPGSCTIELGSLGAEEGNVTGWIRLRKVLRGIRSTYDSAGRLATVYDDYDGTGFSYSYDAFGRVTTIDNTVQNGANTLGPSAGLPVLQWQQQFDLAGRRVGLTLAQDGQTILSNAYGYNPAGWMSSITQSVPDGSLPLATKSASFSYNKLGQFNSISRGLGTSGIDVIYSAYGYDPALRLTSLTHSRQAAVLASYSISEYDQLDRIKTIQRPDSSGDGGATFDYSTVGRLQSVDYANANWPDESYAFTSNGNRSPLAPSASWNYQPQNRLQSDGQWTYRYDAEGNLTEKTHVSNGQKVSYSWDHRNRLTQIVFRTNGNITKTIDYTYDVLDRRMVRRVEDAAGIRTRRFIYDGDRLLATLDQNNNVEERYFNGPEADQVLAAEKNGQVRWLLADHQNSVRDVLAVDGQNVRHVVYDSFGKVIGEQNVGEQTAATDFVATTQPPASTVPENLFRWMQMAKVCLSWDPVPNSTGYEVCRFTQSTKDWTNQQAIRDAAEKVFVTTSPDFMDESVQQISDAASSYYYYRVRCLGEPAGQFSAQLEAQARKNVITAVQQTGTVAPADHVRALTPAASAFEAVRDTNTQLYYWRAGHEDCSITFGSNRLGSGTYEVQVRWATVTEEGDKKKTKLTVQHAGSEPTVLELTQEDTQWHSLGIWEFRGINASVPTPWEGIKQEGAVVNGQVSTGWVSGYFKFVRLGNRRSTLRAPDAVKATRDGDGPVEVSWLPYATETYTMSTDATQTARTLLVPTGADEYEVWRSVGGQSQLVGRTRERIFTDADAPADAEYSVKAVRENEAIGYTGQAWDEEAGLAYYKARWYDPSVGRFLSQDPAGEGDNHYLYVHGDPVNFTDPTGLCGKNSFSGGSGFTLNQTTYPTYPGGFGDWSKVPTSSGTGNYRVPLPDVNNFGSGSYGMSYVLNTGSSFGLPARPEVSSQFVGGLDDQLEIEKIQARGLADILRYQWEQPSYWDYAWAITKGVGVGIAIGGKNVVVGTGKALRETGYQAADAANSTLFLVSGREMYKGNLSQLGQASVRDEFSYTTHVAETGANAVTFGTYGQGKVLYLYATGQIDVNTASEQLGAAGLMQLGSAAMVQSGFRAAGARGPGQEFSHFIPNRMGGPRSKWNGNFVSTKFHALSDPYRYRFMPATWKSANPMPPRAVQLWDRVPQTVKGVGAAAAMESQSPIPR